MKHTLKIKGKKIELTTNQAKKLLQELKEAFGEPPVFAPYIPNFPSPFEAPVVPYTSDPIWRIPDQPTVACKAS